MRLFILIAILCGSLASCADERILDGNTGIGSKGENIWLSLVVPDAKEVQTRAANENALDNVYLLVFRKGADDGTTTFIECREAEGTGESAYNFAASLTPQTSPCLIYVVANTPIIINRMIDEGRWIAGSTTLAQVKRDLLKDKLVNPANQNQIIKMPALPPMVSLAPIEVNEIKSAMVISDVILMERATAKVTLTTTSPGLVINGSGHGASLFNAPVQGYVFGGMDVSGILRANYCGESPAGSGSYSEGVMMSKASAVSPLYGYESPVNSADPSKNAYLIIKAAFNGVDGYYRINLKDENRNPLPLKRNHWYNVNLKKVQTPGYYTLAEAKASTALNDLPGTDIDIDISDSYSHDIVSNGSEYLGVSNSELIIYQSGSLTNVEAVKLSYTVPGGGWMNGSITVHSTSGMSLSAGTSSILPVSDVTDQPIYVNLPPNCTGGTLTFRIGNLYKVVKVTRNGNLPSIPGELEFEKIAVADKAMDANRSNISFSTESGIFPDDSHLTDRFFHEAGKDLYVKINPNVGYNPSGTGGSTRKGEFLLAHSNDEGKIKFVYEQDFMDLYYGLVQIKPYTYVGTFHRHNEMAERIIRIKVVDKGPNKQWTAVVVSGEDWIELDTTPSEDPGMTQFPYGYDEGGYDWANLSRVPATSGLTGDNPVWNTAALVEENGQFKPDQKGKSVVHGPGDRDIYFRVGLKGYIQPKEVRYGLIALIHSGGNHLIYVRQGEAPDYLMRDGDEFARPLAVKISPFNLTVPNAQNGPGSVDLAENGGVMTDYPSRGGYLFKGGRRRGYNSYGSPTDVRWSESTATVSNLCPWGRLPSDGPDGTSGYVHNSELRQSFWLKPQDNFARSNYDNMIRGFIADGYYDRRRMRYPSYSFPLVNFANYKVRSNSDYSKDGRDTYQGISDYNALPVGLKYSIPSVVDETEGVNMAFAGMLLFNPYNLASIFLPATGSREAQFSTDGIYGYQRGMGLESNLWTSTEVSGGQAYLATGGYNSVGASKDRDYFIFDNYKGPSTGLGLSIRCVDR